MIIDFSAYDTWGQCPGKWWEKYVAKRQPRRPKAQRDDALALGSLVHEGLRIWQTNHVVGIPDGVVDEIAPTRECYNLALELVYGYARAYPAEQWPLVMCEEPVQFPLEHCFDHGFQPCGCPQVLTGLAKIDSYFYVPELTTLESGVPGNTCMLEPGWWIHEYKTKADYIPMGIYMQGWEMGMQASFQTMALEHLVANYAPSEGERDMREEFRVEHNQVQGVLVNVLEKPRRYIPKRKCLNCQEYYEFYSWLPTGTGEYACHVCGKRQKLKPLDMDTPTVPPAYYRFVVTRTRQKLEHHRDAIIKVGQQMIEMEQQGLLSVPWNTRNCVDTKWKKACEYFGPHNNYQDTAELIDFEGVPEYRGLPPTEN